MFSATFNYRITSVLENDSSLRCLISGIDPVDHEHMFKHRIFC